MRIAVVGCGALGSYYGAQLCRAGLDVWFLLRSDFDTVRAGGVHVRSPAGDFHVRPHAADSPTAIGPVDLVLVSLKTTANHELPRLLPPLVRPDTAVVTLQNGLGNEEALARLIPAEQILGGLCFVCLNRLAPGLIHHIDHGRIVLGEYQRPARKRTHAFADLVRRAGVPCDVTDDLARAHWEKLAWNIPFNGLGVASSAGWDAFETAPPRSAAGDGDPAMAGKVPTTARIPRRGPCLTTDLLMADGRWHRLVCELILEIVRAAQALGHPLDDSLVDLQIQRTLTMGAYQPSTVIDFERGQPLELESLFLEPLRQARRAGVPMPRLERLARVLGGLSVRA